MRVLIVKNAPFHRTGGATVTDRAIGPQLVAAGHACVWVGTLCVWSPSGEVDTEAQERAQLRALDIEAIEGTWPIRFEERGMEVHLVRSTVDLPAYLEALSAAEPFDWIVLNGHLVPETMGRLLEVFPPERTVISCMACMGLLFGRNREYDRPDVLDMFRRVRDVFCPSEHVRRYLAESEVKATTLYLPVFGPGPFPKLGDPEGFILMVNPAQMKDRKSVV